MVLVSVPSYMDVKEYMWIDGRGNWNKYFKRYWYDEIVVVKDGVEKVILQGTGLFFYTVGFTKRKLLSSWCSLLRNGCTSGFQPPFQQSHDINLR